MSISPEFDAWNYVLDESPPSNTQNDPIKLPKNKNKNKKLKPIPKNQLLTMLQKLNQQMNQQESSQESNQEKDTKCKLHAKLKAMQMKRFGTI